MERKLGQEYEQNMPSSAIISNRLVQIQQYYSGLELSASIQRSKRNKCLKQIDRHVINLMETYGQSKVEDTYNMIFSLNNERKAI